MSLRPWIAERAASSPDGLALVHGDQRLDWRGLAEQAHARAAFLAGQGLGAGDLVAVRSADPVVFAGFLHAAQLLGATLLPIHARLTEAEVRAQLEHAKPRAFFADPKPVGGDARPPAGLPAQIRPDADLVVLFTSGTTGRPKAARLSHQSFAASAAASAAHLDTGRGERPGDGPGDRWLACLPLYHVGGISILVRSVLSGAPVFVHSGFDPGRVWSDLSVQSISHVSLVPTMLKRMLEWPGDIPACPSLRIVLLGGAASAPDLVARARQRGLPVCPTYGLTEACSQVATVLPGDSDPGRARPLPGVEVRVDPLPALPALPGQDRGEILVRGATVFSGYLGDPGASATALRDGWLHTGDMGALGFDGRLRVFGRSGDLLVSGGENVSPLEVEAVLEGHPAVAEAAVLGVDDADLGQQVVALVVVREQARPDDDDLAGFCRQHLAGFKVPRAFRRTRALPRNTLGKLVRSELAQRFWNSESWSR